LTKESIVVLVRPANGFAQPTVATRIHTPYLPRSANAKKHYSSSAINRCVTYPRSPWCIAGATVIFCLTIKLLVDFALDLHIYQMAEDDGY
jgi:hypothetical protein